MSGILCPRCRGFASRVLDSRPYDGGIRRRRQCEACGARFTTREQINLGSGEYCVAATVMRARGAADQGERCQ